MFTLPDLPYDYKALEPYIDEETMHLHHDKHHAAYIKNLNDGLNESEKTGDDAIEAILGNLDSIPESVRTKVRNNGGGHYNHTLFWKMMAPGKPSLNEGKLMEAIKSTFSDLNQLQEKINSAGVSQFGSGWTWLISDKGMLSITSTPNQDSPIMDGKHPILGIDVWEHAYYLRYKNMRGDYLKAWWNVANWPYIEELYSKSF